MKKNLMFGSIITAVLLLGVGCGGGSSSDSDESATGEVSVDKTGYYLDSAVMGLTYHCSSQGENSSDDNGTTSEDDNGTTSEDDNGTTSEDDNGTTSEDDNGTEKLQLSINKTFSGSTSADGEFTYQDGQTCTFSVGGVVIREIDTSNMEDNIVFEDNIHTAQFLQTLDNDGNPDNGIQINAAVRSAIASGEVDLHGEVPQTDAQLTELVNTLQDKVSSYEGQIVHEEEARSHLEDTRSAIEAMGGHIDISVEGEGSSSEEGDAHPADIRPETPMGVVSDHENATAEEGSSSEEGHAHPADIRPETPIGVVSSHENNESNSDNNESSSDNSTSGEAHAEASPSGGQGSAGGTSTSPRASFR